MFALLHLLGIFVNGRIPKRTITIIAGHQKSGKSLVSCAIAATISRGGSFPCSKRLAKRGRVNILNAEDDPATVLRHRLAAAGADLSRTVIPTHGWPSGTDRFEGGWSARSRE